ncbi:MAG: PD-(D/E)XK nuclease family protein [Thermoanaerobaculia bacterium]
MSPRTASRILVAPDSLAAERALVGELSRLADADPLARKTVVVPSHSLRVALLARLAGLRPAWLGLEVVTLRGLARAILERGGRDYRSGDALLPVVVERLARRERALARHLETLVDGFAGAQGAVRDLLDAGFGEEHLEAALERLEEERNLLGGDALDRTAALCQIAAASRGELAALGLAVDADLYTQAAELLVADPDCALPATTLFVHGFADATGVASDLLTELVRQRPAIAILLDPWDLDGTSRVTWRFGRRLAERLAGIAAVEPLDVPPAPARLRLYSAADPARETRAAIGLLAARVGAGERPEEIAFVARDPAPFGSLLAREIDRQALPASGSDGPASPLARRARGLLELIERQGDAALGLAFAVAGEFLARGSGARPWELRLGALALGARRLATLTELEIAQDQVLLPVRDHFAARAASAPGGGAPTSHTLAARPRSLPAGALRRTQRQAKALLGRLAAQNRRLSLAAAMAGVADLVRALVDSAEEQQALLAPLAALVEAGAAVPPAFEVTAAESALLLRDAWSGLGSSALGGAGGGVALLAVAEARGRTLDHLVLAGLTRDRFPRAVRPDPFFPDSLRARLRDLLPDLPVKSEGHDEERFLFAQLLGSAPEIDLFAASADEDGKLLSPSSFLDELRRAGRLGEAVAAPEPAVQSALDSASWIALTGDRARLAPALALAYEEGATRFPLTHQTDLATATAAEPAPRSTAARWAASHVALLAELAADPLDSRSDRLGPFFGFVGAAPPPEWPGAGPGAEPGDPRAPSPAVTTLQELAGCGWRAFLGKLLRLGKLPAGEDEIPELPSYLVGTVVHAVLEEMASPALREVKTLAVAEASAGDEVIWPEAPQLAAAIARETRRTLVDEGFDPDLFALPIEVAAAETLEVVRRLDWPTGRRLLLGIEVDGTANLTLPAGGRTVGFRADRVEQAAEGLLLSDYKTGNSVVSSAVKASTRQAHLEKSLAAGKWLQLPAYARARAAQAVEGRLLFLKDDLEDDRREAYFSAPAAGSAADVADRLLWQTLFAAWEGGTFLPRLLAEDLQSPYEGCSYCDVRVACLQGDSGARLRLERWVRLHRGQRPAAEATVAAGGAAGGAPGRPIDAAAASEESAWQLFKLRDSASRDSDPEGS